MANCKYKTVKIKKSTKKDKKLMAIFDNLKTIHFGAKGYTDFTTNKDLKRKSNYLKRHKSNENWNKCDTAGSLSKHLLWGKTTSLEKVLIHIKEHLI